MFGGRDNAVPDEKDVNILVLSVNRISIKLINTYDRGQHVNVDDHNIAYIQFQTLCSKFCYLKV